MRARTILFFFILFATACVSGRETVENNEKEKVSKLAKKNIEIPDIDSLMIPIKKSDETISDIDYDVDDIEVDEKNAAGNKSDNQKYKKEKIITKLDKDRVEKKPNENLIAANNLDFTSVDNVKIKELDLKEMTLEEDNQVYISLMDPGWVIKKIDPPHLKLIKRENFEKNTLFKFVAEAPSSVTIIFIRNDEENNTIIRQPYKINIISKGFSEFKVKKEELKKNSAKQKAKNEKQEVSQEKLTGDTFFSQGRFVEAKKHYLNAINEAGDDAEIYYKLGIIEKNFNNYGKAHEYFTLASNDRESSFYLDSVFELIKILKMQKKFKEAIDVFYKHELLNKSDEKQFDEIYLILADLYFNFKNYEDALKHYRRFLQIFPDSIYFDKALFYLAYSLENLQINPDFREAYSLYKKIVSEFPQSDYYDLSKKRIMYLERHYLNIN